MTTRHALGHVAAAYPRSTDARNTSSPHWRSRLRPENRCLVPFNSFADYAPELVRAQRRSAAVFLRGIWTEFKGDGGMKSKPVPAPRSMAS
jgi:putative SOS response-associated peptidase YedK